MITIPARFELIGHTIRVEYDSDLIDEESAYGTCDPQKQLIKLQPPGPELTKEFVLQTFLHEAVHMWCYYMGYMNLYEDEKFVDLMGHCIYQFLKSKRGQPA